MTKISIEEIEPGMLLASEMRTRQGRLLLPSGAEVTREHLKIARIWGITEADVVDGSDVSGKSRQSSLENLDPELKKALNALTEWRFACCDPGQAVIRKLKTLFKSQEAQILTRNNFRQTVDKYRGPKVDTSTKPRLPQDFCRPDLDEMVRTQAKLASLPDVFHEIVEVIKSPTSSASHIAEVISKDASISSRLLRLVNSSFYGFMSKIDTLTRAVAVVGTVEITNLTMGIAVTSSFKDIPPEIIDMKDFWEHSIAVGVVARILATQTGLPNLERVFVGGLLHDIGRLTFIQGYPSVLKEMLVWEASRPMTLHQLEKKIFDFTHARLGRGLLEEWKIPEELCSMVANHHAQYNSKDPIDLILVKTADAIAHSLGYGRSGSRRVPPFTDYDWKSTGLSMSILPSIAAQAANQIRDLTRIIIMEHKHAA